MNLSPTEIKQLKTYKGKLEAKIIRYIIGISITMLFVAFMPFIIFAGRKGVKVVSGKGETMLGLLGEHLFLGFTVAILLLFVFSLAFDHRYIQIIWDLYKKEKTTIKVKVLRTEELVGVDFHEIELTFQPEYKNKNKIDFFDYPEFPLLVKNQSVEIDVTTTAVFPLCIKAYGKTYRIQGVSN